MKSASFLEEFVVTCRSIVYVFIHGSVFGL
jgi:hypothetical protein